MDSGSCMLPGVAGLGKSDMSPRGGGIGPRGRRRRPRVPKHVGNVYGDVPTGLYGGRRSQNDFSILESILPLFLGFRHFSKHIAKCFEKSTNLRSNNYEFWY